MNKMSRTILCLAALDIPSSELFRLLEELQKTPPEKIVDKIRQVRRNMLHVNENKFFERRQKQAKSLEQSVGQRVERLLKKEANLATSRAVQELTSKLIALDLIFEKDVPPLSRKSLRDWTNRLVKKVSAKDILRAATIVRNEHIHRPVDDWLIPGIRVK